MAWALLELELEFSCRRSSRVRLCGRFPGSELIALVRHGVKLEF